MDSMKLKISGLIVGAGLLLVGFQNCGDSRMGAGSPPSTAKACQMIARVIEGPDQVGVGSVAQFSIGGVTDSVRWTLETGEGHPNPAPPQEVPGYSGPEVEFQIDEAGPYILKAENRDSSGCPLGVLPKEFAASSAE